MSHRLGYMILFVVSLISVAGCQSDLTSTESFESLLQLHHDQTQSLLDHYQNPQYPSSQSTIGVIWSGETDTIHGRGSRSINRRSDQGNYIEDWTGSIAMLGNDDDIARSNQHHLQIKKIKNDTYLRLDSSTGNLNILPRLDTIASLTGNQERYHLTSDVYQGLQGYQTYLNGLMDILYQSGVWVVTASQQTSAGTSYDLILDTDYLKNVLVAFYGSGDRSQQVQKHYLFDYYLNNLVVTGKLEKVADSAILTLYGSQGSGLTIQGNIDAQSIDLVLKRDDTLDHIWKLTCTQGSCQLGITHGSLTVLQGTIVYAHQIEDQSHTSYITVDLSGPNVSLKSNIDIQTRSSDIALDDDNLID